MPEYLRIGSIDMEWEVVDAVPIVPEVERPSERFGRENERRLGRQEDRNRAAPLPDWLGRVIDIFV